MTELTVSNLVLWVLQISTIVVVVGLARQVGVLHMRLRPLGAGPTEDGPPVGARFDLPPVVSLRGDQTPVTAPGYLSLITFANPGCSSCAPTMQAVKRLRAVERDVRFIVAVDGEQGHGVKYAESYGLTDVVGSGSLEVMSSTSRPFAIVLSQDGTVLATGVPNTLEQLEMLLAKARHENSVGHGLTASDGHLPPHDGGAAIPVPEFTLPRPAADTEGSGDRA